MEQEYSVADRLQTLIEFNDPISSPITRNGQGEFHPMTIHELQQFNQEQLAGIADLLGMSELYLYKEESSHERTN